MMMERRQQRRGEALMGGWRWDMEQMHLGIGKGRVTSGRMSVSRGQQRRDGKIALIISKEDCPGRGRRNGVVAHGARSRLAMAREAAAPGDGAELDEALIGVLVSVLAHEARERVRHSGMVHGAGVAATATSGAGRPGGASGQLPMPSRPPGS